MQLAGAHLSVCNKWLQPASINSGNASTVAFVSPRIYRGYSSSSRAVDEPLGTNYRLTGQFYNVTLERGIHTDNGVIRAPTTYSVALSFPNSHVPQQLQGYSLDQLSKSYRSVHLYCRLNNVSPLNVYESPPSLNFNVGNNGLGSRASAEEQFYIDEGLRRSNHISNAYHQDYNRDIISPHSL